MEILAKYVAEIWSFIGGLAAGAVGGSLLTLRYTRTTSASGHGSIVDQSRTSAGGDVVGRDKLVGRDQR